MRQRQQPWPTASITLIESAMSSSFIGAVRGISISIFVIDRDVVEVKATAGDTHLGGDDFDNHLVSIFMGEFLKEASREHEAGQTSCFEGQKSL